MMGNPDATTEELMAAIKSAHLQDMIAELPDGLDKGCYYDSENVGKSKSNI